MKLSTTISIALFIAASVRFASAEEKPAPFITALSSTTISGYVNTGTQWWQPHTCRPARPVRTQPVVVDPTNGAPRVVGHVVRCRHALMFIPSVGESRVFPTPNRSSRFAVSSPIKHVRRRRPVVQPPVPPSQPPPPPILTNRPPGGGIIVTSVPPILRPPIYITNWPSSGTILTSQPPRFRVPIGTTNQFSDSPLRIIPGLPEGVTLQVRQWDSATVFSGAVLINANRPLIQVPIFPPLPPTPVSTNVPGSPPPALEPGSRGLIMEVTPQINPGGYLSVP